LYEQHAVQKAGSEEYDHVWHAVRDSIHLWANNHLSGFDIYVDFPWYLGSLICFNKEMNRCKMVLSYQQGLWSPSDGMNYFNSAKINDRWCFFFEGGHFVLPRDYYLWYSPMFGQKSSIS